MLTSKLYKINNLGLSINSMVIVYLATNFPFTYANSSINIDGKPSHTKSQLSYTTPLFAIDIPYSIVTSWNLNRLISKIN